MINNNTGINLTILETKSDSDNNISSESDITNDKTIPLKVLYYSLKKHKRNSLYSELFYYIIFLGLFIYLNLNVMNITNAYQQNSIVYDHFLDEEFEHSNYKKTFFDIGNADEYLEWLDGPFYNGFFEKNNIIDYNHPIGGLFIRQSRIQKIECSILKDIKYCYNSYNSNTRFTGNYLNTICKNDAYPILYGKTEYNQYYGKDGCVIYLPFNKTLAKEKILYIKEHNWVDKSTRAISIYFNLYNSNTKLLTNGRFMIEFFPSGFAQPSYRLITMPYRPNGSSLSFYIVGLLFSIGLFYFILVEFFEYRRKKRKLDYFLNKWNIIECFNLCLFISVITIFMYWKYNINKKSYLQHLSNKSDTFDYYSNSYLFYHIGLLSATCCLVSFIKIFKYLRLNRRLKLLWDTLSSAFADLFSMFIVSLLIISGFALMGNLIFGQNLDEFKSFSSSVSMLLRSLLGDFNYKRMSEICPNIAPIYFIFYIFIVFFVITNMFVAVVCEYFQKVNEYSRDLEKNKKCVIVTSFLEKMYINICYINLCFCCSNKTLSSNKIKRKRFSLNRRKTFSDLWKSIENEKKNNNKLIKYLFPKWTSIKHRYIISNLFDQINFDDNNYKKIFHIYETSKSENLTLNINELNEITNNNDISIKIIDTYQKYFHN
jgi:hypothetical protein